MKFSVFGEKFSRSSGISGLMDDLGSALVDNPSLLFMGGGNPGRVEGAQEIFAKQLTQLLEQNDTRHALLGTYQSPAGDPPFRAELAAYLNKRFAWGITAEHIAIANGSQSAFFILSNMLAGTQADGSECQIHFPMSPEYVGYGDAGLTDNFFSATQPRVEKYDDGFFKYHLDVDALAATLHPDSSIAALCVSRPSNPTGNVVSDDELQSLDALARGRELPLIIDGAYGAPFPGLLYTDAEPLWNDNTILMLSLSKLGLPGVRTGLLIARPEITRAFARANTVVSLATGTLGPLLLRGMLADGSLDTLCTQRLLPFYRERRALALSVIKAQRGNLPVWVHRAEGAFFLWIWCEGLPIDSKLLYERLKERGVIVLPGNDFFVGLSTDWSHRRECLRVSYAGDRHTIEEGLTRVMQELHRAYAEG